MPKMRIKREDRVRVISGPEKGKEGRVIRVLREENRVVVENVNVVQKTQRPTQENPRGGYREQEMPIHASNVMIIDPKTGEPTRVGMKFLDDGRKVRIARKSGAQLDE